MENGKKIELIEDVATLKADIKHIKEKLDENHDEVKSLFSGLQKKVNEEITTAHASIASNRKPYIRLLIIAMVAGSFIWIQESRDWIVANIFRF